MKRTLILGFLCVALIRGTARADFTLEDWKQLAMIEGAVGVSSYIIANNPKEWGTVFVVTSPLLAGIAGQGEFSWPRYAMGIAIIGGIGAWLISQEDEDQNDIAKKIIIGYNALLLPLWVISKTSESPASPEENKVDFRWEPRSKQALVIYTFRF